MYTYKVILLWDFDGVLVISEDLHQAKLIETALKYGVRLSEEDFHVRHRFKVPNWNGAMEEVCMQLYGAGDKNIYYWLLSQKPELRETLSLNQWLDDLLAYYIENKQKLKPRENIGELIKKFGDEGAIQCIVTSGVPQQVEANLSVLPGIKERMTIIHDASASKRSKPFPDPYDSVLEALKQSGTVDLNSACIVIIEDSPPGVRSALDAGKKFGLSDYIGCVQFLLPGQLPVEVSEKDKSRVAVAYTADEVKAAIRNWIRTRASLRPGFCETRPKISFGTPGPQ